jgi:Zn-dependent protease with chaperone function
MLVENPDVSNAFSYGFGADGAGGIVVYTGFLDEILSKGPSKAENNPESPIPEEMSWWSYLLGGFTSVSSRQTHPVPTSQQSTDLAILLAHELSHLLLAHHLETLSSATVVVPGLLSMVADVVRVLLFPLTMAFGPFVNDAVAQIGRLGHADLTKMTENCAGVKQEIEADIVSAR